MQAVINILGLFKVKAWELSNATDFEVPEMTRTKITNNRPRLLSYQTKHNGLVVIYKRHERICPLPFSAKFSGFRNLDNVNTL